MYSPIASLVRTYHARHVKAILLWHAKAQDTVFDFRSVEPANDSIRLNYQILADGD